MTRIGMKLLWRFVLALCLLQLAVAFAQQTSGLRGNTPEDN
jgi:hypothetical protein